MSEPRPEAGADVPAVYAHAEPASASAGSGPEPDTSEDSED